jgi:hypothetical protein|tara:strand:+ start:199 stop:768 length:570 start_codon:yes stop_codon:yes gene_type:complete
MNISDKKYTLTNFSYVKKNLQHFKSYAFIGHKRFKNVFGEKDATAFYNRYNCINLLGGSSHYYKLFKDVFKTIRKYSNTVKPLWIQCWLNIHDENQLLKWHTHYDSLFHGFICIDPKHTETVFENYTIKNKIGNVYVGPSNIHHKVVNKKPFVGERITIGFDILDESIIKKIYKKEGKEKLNISFIPVY